MRAFTKIQLIFFLLPPIFFDLMIFFTMIGSINGIGISFFLMIVFGIYDVYLLLRPAIVINEKFVRIGKNKIMISDVKEIKVEGKGKYYTVIVVKKDGEVFRLENVYKGDKALTLFERFAIKSKQV